MASATLALPCAAYEVGPLESTHCGATIRIVALIDDAGVIERILKQLSVSEPQLETPSPAGPDPPWPRGETIPLTYHPVPDIAVGDVQKPTNLAAAIDNGDNGHKKRHKLLWFLLILLAAAALAWA